jgi:hypothetical protein
MGGDFSPAIGTNERVEGMDVLSAAAVTNRDGVATVVATLVNTGDQPNALVDARVSSDRSDIVTFVPEPVEVPVEKPVQISTEQAVTLVSPNLPVGRMVELTLEFERGPSADLLIPVEPQEGPYAEIEVTAPPDSDISPS